MFDRLKLYEAQAASRAARKSPFYQRLLRRYYAFLVPAGLKVLEVGCGTGDLLAAVSPVDGLGLDFSPAMIDFARNRHPKFRFQVLDAGNFASTEKFDYILLSDLLNDLPDVQNALERLRSAATPRTRLVVNFFNNLWRPALVTAEKCGFKEQRPPQNWLSKDDVINLVELAGWEVIKTDARTLWPINSPPINWVLNRWLAPIFTPFCLTILLVARLKPALCENRQFRCSVIIPARNESGNIENAVQRVPDMGSGTEIIFVEGHSRDDTWEEIQKVALRHPNRSIKSIKQQSYGKGGAVRGAFAAATGDLLFILDADLTVPPEELPKFYEVARSGLAEFVNGVRLVYPMEDEAMQFSNMVANKFFGLAFSWMLGQKIKDTLCGTKVMFRDDYILVAKHRGYFGDFDPFGDFDLLFGAAKLNLRIVDLPIRYRARTYGTTNISRWRHGLLLLRMMIFAGRRLKFIG